MRLLSASFYIDSQNFSVYRTIFLNEEEILNVLFDYFLTTENNKAFIYAHNTYRFDLTFILKSLLNRSNINKVDHLYKEGKLLSLKFKYNVKSMVCFITLRESLLILVSTLDKLCENFKLETQKDIFPYNLPKKIN